MSQVELHPVGSGFIWGLWELSSVLERSLLPGYGCLLNLLSAILSAYIAKGIPILEFPEPRKVYECMTKKKSDTEKVKRGRRGTNGKKSRQSAEKV